MKTRGLIIVGAAAATLAVAPSALATFTDPDERIPFSGGNAATECARVLDVIESAVKFDEFDTVVAPATEGAVTITATNGYVFSWVSSSPVDAVIVKAGTEANIYRPGGAMSSALPYYGPGGREISHVTFCYHDDAPPPPPPPPPPPLPPTVPGPPPSAAPPVVVPGAPTGTGTTRARVPGRIAIRKARVLGRCQRVLWGKQTRVRVRIWTAGGRRGVVRVRVRVPEGMALTTPATRQGWRQSGRVIEKRLEVPGGRRYRTVKVTLTGITAGRKPIRVGVIGPRNGKRASGCRTVVRPALPITPAVTA